MKHILTVVFAMLILCGCTMAFNGEAPNGVMGDSFRNDTHGGQIMQTNEGFFRAVSSDRRWFGGGSTDEAKNIVSFNSTSIELIPTGTEKLVHDVIYGHTKDGARYCIIDSEQNFTRSGHKFYTFDLAGYIDYTKDHGFYVIVRGGHETIPEERIYGEDNESESIVGNKELLQSLETKLDSFTRD